MIVADRNNRQKHVRRAEIVLLTVSPQWSLRPSRRGSCLCCSPAGRLRHAWHASMTEDAPDFDTSCRPRGMRSRQDGLVCVDHLPVSSAVRWRACRRGSPGPSPAKAACRRALAAAAVAQPIASAALGSTRLRPKALLHVRRGARHETNDDLGLGPAGPDRRWGGGAAARLLPRTRAVAGAAEPGPGRVPELGRAADRCRAGCPRAAPPRAGGRARGAAAGATAAAITGNDAGKGAAAGMVGGAAAQRGARRQDRRQAAAQQQQAGAASGRAMAACMQGRGYTGG